MRDTVVLNVVGLTPAHLGEATPHLTRLARQGGMQPLVSVMPAVTCTAQSTFLTGLAPDGHGIVGNGWLFRELAEIMFWRQSSRLVEGERVWEAGRARDPGFTCANLFWWFAMASTADIAVTPRPIYAADGRKLPDCWAQPQQLRDELTARLGTFPLFQFWGPGTSIVSSRWIADAALHVRATRKPTLTLVYLPHLDYALQRRGPDDPANAVDLGEIDAVCGTLIDEAERAGARIVVLSEYGITRVTRPVHVNRYLREAGLLAFRLEQGREVLDPSQSRALAVADHQVAHVYVRDAADIDMVAALVAEIGGVERVLDEAGKRAFGLAHPRSGELVLIAEPDAWFTYYHWLDDARAPDFARLVEIHKKPGYDPVELFIDPAIRRPKLAIGWRLAKRRIGFGALMDVIPLDATLVKGSHGRPCEDSRLGPLFISSDPALAPAGPVDALSVKQRILDHVFG